MVDSADRDSQSEPRVNFIVETNWINKEMHKGIDRHHRSLEQACESVEGAEFMGLFKPLNIPWNWTHFLELDSLEQWRDVDREVHRLYPDMDNNVFYSMSSIFAGWPRDRQITNSMNLEYLSIDLSICKEVDHGIHEFYIQNCDYFEGLEGVKLLGLYVSWSENWTWALFKLFDSLRKLKELELDFIRTYKRIPEITNSIFRIYERYEP